MMASVKGKAASNVDVDLDDEWDDILCAEPEKEFVKPKKKTDEAGLGGNEDDEGWGDVIAIEIQEGYCGILMKQMENFRRQNVLCDAIIVVDDQEMPVHRNILSAASPFFNEIFSRITNPEDNKITLRNLSGRTMDDILHFTYTGEAVIHDDNVRQLVACANFLQLQGLKDMAVAYLERKLGAANAMEILVLAIKHDCASLRESAEKIVCDNFSLVSKTDGFKKCNLETLDMFIASENLKVLKEEEVYEAVIEWVKYDVYDREKHFPKLLQHVRLPLMPPFYLKEIVERDELVQRNPACLELVLEAKNYHLPSADRTRFNTLRTTPRKFMGVVWGIVAVGGWQQNKPTKDVYAFVPSTGKWHPLSPLHRFCYNHAVLTCDGFIYVIGGRDDSTKLITMASRFDPSANKWSNIAPLPYPLAALGAVAFDGQLYIVGGLGHWGSVNLVYKYSIRMNTWQNVCPLNVPRGGLCVVANERNIFALGGMKKTGANMSSSWEYLDTMEIYDKERNVWNFATPLSSPRAYASAVYMNHRIYVVGGQGEMLGISKGLDIYNTETHEWTSLPYLGIPRSMSGISVESTKFYVVGGMTKDGECVDTVETYDAEKDRWRKITSLPVGLGALQCCTIQLRLAVLQGMTTSLSE